MVYMPIVPEPHSLTDLASERRTLAGTVDLPAAFAKETVARLLDHQNGREITRLR